MYSLWHVTRSRQLPVAPRRQLLREEEEEDNQQAQGSVKLFAYFFRSPWQGAARSRSRAFPCAASLLPTPPSALIAALLDHLVARSRNCLDLSLECGRRRNVVGLELAIEWAWAFVDDSPVSFQTSRGDERATVVSAHPEGCRHRLQGGEPRIRRVLPLVRVRSVEMQLQRICLV